MPEELERRLWQEAREKFPNDTDRQRRYVYGALRATGWRPRRFRRGDRERSVDCFLHARSVYVLRS